MKVKYVDDNYGYIRNYFFVYRFEMVFFNFKDSLFLCNIEKYINCCSDSRFCYFSIEYFIYNNEWLKWFYFINKIVFRLEVT